MCHCIFTASALHHHCFIIISLCHATALSNKDTYNILQFSPTAYIRFAVHSSTPSVSRVQILKPLGERGNRREMEKEREKKRKQGGRNKRKREKKWNAEIACRSSLATCTWHPSFTRCKQILSGKHKLDYAQSQSINFF